jgi:hypothetical protein
MEPNALMSENNRHDDPFTRDAGAIVPPCVRPIITPTAVTESH